MDSEQRAQLALRHFFIIGGQAPGGTYFAAQTTPIHKKGEFHRPSFFVLHDPNFKAYVAQVLRKSDNNREEAYLRCTMLKHVPEKRGKKEDTAGSSVLWVDIDAKQGRTVESILEMLRTDALPPSYVVLSGNGVHAYWRLREFTQDLAAVETRNKALALRFGADMCFSVCHVLRIPGTFNFKDPENPKLVTVAEGFDLERRYSLADFPAENLDQLEIHISSVELEPLADNFLNDLQEEAPSLASKIATGKGFETDDRSARDYHIVNALLELGFSPGVALSVICHPLWSSGSKYRSHTHGDYYAQKTVVQCVLNQEQKRRATYRHLLDPVLMEIGLIYFDQEKKKWCKNGSALTRGSDIVTPAIKFLYRKGYQFYFSEDVPYILTPDGSVYIADRGNDRYNSWIGHISGFTTKEREFSMLADGFITYITFSAPRNIKLTKWCHLDADRHTFWVRLNGQINLKVPPGQPPIVTTNGTDEIVLLPPRYAKELQWIPTADIAAELTRFLNQFTNVLAMTPAARSLFTCYALALPIAYGAPLETFPHIHLVGPPGEGKSQTLKMLSAWLFGDEVLVTQTLAAAYRVMDREIMLPCDEMEKVSEGFETAINMAASGGAREKSGHGTDDVIEQRAHISIVRTSVTATEKEATRRRTFVINVNQKLTEPGVFFDPQGQWRKIAAQRDLLWSAYLQWLAARVLPRLQDLDISACIATAMKGIPLRIFHALAPFMTYMWLIGEELERIVPGAVGFYGKSLEEVIRWWADELGFGDPEEIEGRLPLLEGFNTIFHLCLAEPEFSAYRFDGLKVTHPKDLKGLPEGKWVGLEGPVEIWKKHLTALTRLTFENRYAFSNAMLQVLNLSKAPGDKKTPSQFIDAGGFKFQRFCDGQRFFWRVIQQSPL